MSRVIVKRDVLRWAMNRSGRPFETLRHKFPKLPEWETGESQPTLRQLESFAKSTVTPLGFFFLDAPPEERLPIPYFRTFRDQPLNRFSADLLETVQTMQRRQAWMREFLIQQGDAPLAFVASARLDETPEALAIRIRGTLGLGQAWAAQQATWTDALRVLRDATEAAEILVAVNGIVGNNTHRKLDPDEFRGFVLADPHVPLVFINGADGKAAQMFTLAHELAHVFFGSSAAFDLREMQPASDPVEQACNSVAAEFLVPAAELRRIWMLARQHTEPFQYLARQFKVSTLVVARRAQDLNLIRRAEFLDFYGAYLRDERRAGEQRPEGGDFYATQNARVGNRFARTVVRAVTEGRLLYSEAYELTGLYGRTFDRYAASLGSGEPR